jgi:hypothetical protein
MTSFSAIEILKFSSELPVKKMLHLFELFRANRGIGSCPLNGINKIVISYFAENDGGVRVLIENCLDIIAPHVGPFNKLHMLSTLF